MAETKILQAKEAKLQSSIVGMQRVQLFVESYTDDQRNQAEHRLQRFESFFEAYTQCFDDILELGVSAECITRLENNRTQVEELYCVTKGKLMDILSETTKKEVKYEAASTSSLSAVKLPTISLPSFNGDYDTWLTFHDTFESLVHTSKELSSIQKFHYLRAALEEAASQIQVLSITSENYDIAWNTLVERYSNTVLLRKKQVRSLLGLPKISKGSVQDLRSIVDKFVLHLKVLQQLGEAIDESSTIIVGLLADKLDDATVTAWEESLEPKQQPTYAQMVLFLRRRIQTMESIEANRPTSSLNVERRKQTSRTHMNAAASATVQQQQNESVCVVCEQNHVVNQCLKFTNATIKERTQIVREKKLCANCLRQNHTAAQCTSKFVCRQCSGRHHTLIHPGLFQQQQQASSPAAQSSSMLAASTTHPAVQGANFVSAILTTVLLVVMDANGGEHLARALLDSGSQPNAMSERLCQQLRLRRKVVDLEITGVDNTTTSARHMVSAEIRSRIGEFNKSVDFIVLRKVTHDIPATPFGTTEWKIPENTDLADPHFNTVGRIDMIIGASHFYTFLKEGRIRPLENGPLLVETVFGWVVTGNPPPPEQRMAMRCHISIVTPSLEDQIERFWKAEEIEATPTASERYCEEFYKETVSRDETGRYSVRLPKQAEHETLIGASKVTALRRFEALERKLHKNHELRQQYNDFMAEYIALNHMTPVEDDAADGPTACYLPHHPVFKDTSTTTKVRVVFDGSAATSTGHSLNDALMVGPVVQDDLLSLVIRFRKYKIAVVADLEKMYRQVLVHPVDRPLQRIIWRFDKSQPVQIYELDTITYGLAPSSFLATRTLLQLVEDEGSPYPLASDAIKRHLYMDDLIAGADSIEDAISLREELATLVSKGGFTFRKWCSNALPVLEGVPPALLGMKSAFNFDLEENIKTLGIRWDPEADVFRLDVSIVTKQAPHSKRGILSSIAQLYDPLGLISPVIVQAKLIMQLIWLLGLHWDEKVPDDLQLKWNIFCEQLSKLQNFTIPRYAFITDYRLAELHCFTDASEAAFGACIYIRSETSDGSVQVSLLTSKSKVAPLKPITIPRLELCAALLGARLFTKVKSALDMQFSACHFWSDSTIVLQWLQAPARTWKTYVANRVAKIQDTTQGSRWRHVSGSDNPADIISRGCSVDELISDPRWKMGPAWFRAPKSTWSSEVISSNEAAKDEQRQDVVTLPVQVVKPNEIFERFSSYSLLLRAVGYCLRFYNNTRNKSRRLTSRSLLVSELEKATTCLVKIVQAEAFTDEVQRFKKLQPVSPRSSLRLLNPFVDGDGVIRVGGRLQQSDAAYEVRHPVVIPGFHPFTQLLLAHQHRKLLHGGISHTLSAVRDGFWPLNGRKAVRSAIRRCHECCRANPHPIVQPEGQLPADRVTANDVFICTGVDYCGPIYLKPIHRKAAARKAYICIFVCLSTKAVHLELVSDLSTAAFLMALDRFVYRKGKPAHIYSDNGTNFIGARNVLHEIYAMLNHSKSKEQIDKHLADDAIQWHLIPPRAPNFGGLWEAAVKVAKTHLVRQLGTASLSEEEMATVLAKIEGCMNSRPLTPLSSDPNDLEALTPGHYLIKRPLQPLPEFNASCASQNQLAKYQRLQRFTQGFWDLWCNEYRKQLNIAHRGQRKEYPLAEGDLIILKEDQLPPTRWPLARVLELHPGPDGISRVATVRTSSGIFKRAINKLCRLEYLS